MLQSKKMTKTIQDYKELRNSGIFFIIMLLIVVTILSINIISNQNKIRDLNNYINLTKANGTIHLDSYYIGRDDGMREGIKYWNDYVIMGSGQGLIPYIENNSVEYIYINKTYCGVGE